MSQSPSQFHVLSVNGVQQCDCWRRPFLVFIFNRFPKRVLLFKQFLSRLYGYHWLLIVTRLGLSDNSEFTQQDGRKKRTPTLVCDKRNRAINWVFCRDLHLSLMFSGLLQKYLFKWRWSLAKSFFKQNYCRRACHKRWPSSFLSRPVA